MEINTDKIKPAIWQTLGVLLIVLFALMIVDKFHGLSESFKSSVPKNTISMSAEGKVTARPDLATITVSVLTTSSTAKAANDKNSESMNKITSFVKQQGVAEADIVTSNFSVYPTYDYSNGRNTINGYQASQMLTIKVRGVDKSTSTLSNILSGSLDNGSNQIQGVNFSFDDPDKFKQEARKQALDKAKQKATELAAASGLRLGKVVTISENSISSPYPLPYALDSAKSQAGGTGASAPSIETGSQDITAQMTVVYEIK